MQTECRNEFSTIECTADIPAKMRCREFRHEHQFQVSFRFIPRRTQPTYQKAIYNFLFFALISSCFYSSRVHEYSESLFSSSTFGNFKGFLNLGFVVLVSINKYVTQKKIARKKWPCEILSAGIFFSGFRITFQTKQQGTTLSLKTRSYR